MRWLRGDPQYEGEVRYPSGVVAEGDDGFALKRVPWYGWLALAVAGWGLYHHQVDVVVAAVGGWLAVKLMRGRI